MFVDGELVASFIRECEDTIEWMQFETELLAIPKTISVAQYPQTRMTLSEAANMSVQPEPHITHGAFAVGTTQNASTPIPKKIANRTATPKELIDDFCTKKPCSLEGLANIAGIDRRQVFKIRNGKAVRNFALIALAEVLKVEPVLLSAKGNNNR
jgi:hypothetical protein